MKRVVSILLFVFAAMSVSAQKKTDKGIAKTQSTPVQQPVQASQSPVYNFKFDLKVLNVIISALQNSQEIDAKTSNFLIQILVAQANDTTLNKQTVLPSNQKGQ